MSKSILKLSLQSDPALWRIALPMIFSNITVPLLGLVNTAVIGHMDNPIYLGGVAVGTMITSFLFMMLMFLRMSTTGLAAQAYGAQNNRKLAQSLVQPLLLALLAGGAIILCAPFLTHQALSIVAGDQAVLQQAGAFLRVRWLSAPAALANLVLFGWLLGVQYVGASVILLVVGNLFNIVLAILLVTVWGWGFKGAAWATVSAEYLTLLLGLFLASRVLHRRQVPRQLLWSAWRGQFRQLMSLNHDILIRSLLLQGCFATLTVLGARLGSDIVAANAMLLNLLTFTAYALDGFAFAVETRAGQAYGARDIRQLQSVWRAACIQAGIVALLFALTYFVAGRAIIACLTSIEELIQVAQHYLFWQILLPVLSVWCYLLDGIFVGITRGQDMRNSMIFSALGFAVTLLTLPWLGNHALWLALAVFMVLRGVSLAWLWQRYLKQSDWFTKELTRSGRQR